MNRHSLTKSDRQHLSYQQSTHDTVSLSTAQRSHSTVHSKTQHPNTNPHTSTQHSTAQHSTARLGTAQGSAVLRYAPPCRTYDCDVLYCRLYVTARPQSFGAGRASVVVGPTLARHWPDKATMKPRMTTTDTGPRAVWYFLDNAGSDVTTGWEGWVVEDGGCDGQDGQVGMDGVVVGWGCGVGDGGSGTAWVMKVT